MSNPYVIKPKVYVLGRQTVVNEELARFLQDEGLVFTTNARAWRHFLELRGNPHADTEIRLLAVEICRVLKKESPNIFRDVELIDAPDGMPSVRVTHSKV
jgi:thymidylate synthase ThyX